MQIEWLKITKFRGKLVNPRSARKSHQGEITVELNGISYVLDLPVFSSTTALAASAARKWRNVEGNMERIRQAIADGLRSVPAVKKNDP